MGLLPSCGPCACICCGCVLVGRPKRERRGGLEFQKHSVSAIVQDGERGAEEGGLWSMIGFLRSEVRAAAPMRQVRMVVSTSPSGRSSARGAPIGMSTYVTEGPGNGLVPLEVVRARAAESLSLPDDFGTHEADAYLFGQSGAGPLFSPVEGVESSGGWNGVAALGGSGASAGFALLKKSINILREDLKEDFSSSLAGKGSKAPAEREGLLGR